MVSIIQIPSANSITVRQTYYNLITQLARNFGKIQIQETRWRKSRNEIREQIFLRQKNFLRQKIFLRQKLFLRQKIFLRQKHFYMENNFFTPKTFLYAK